MQQVFIIANSSNNLFLHTVILLPLLRKDQAYGITTEREREIACLHASMNT
jgi:hypothetical protein